MAKIVKNIKRLRFTYQDDLALLKEFLAHNPLENVENWNIIQENVTNMQRKKFLVKTLKNHVQLLLETWIKQEELHKVQSGVEEPYSERDALLQEVHALCGESKVVKKKKNVDPKEKQIRLLGTQARETFAMQSFHEQYIEASIAMSRDIDKTNTPENYEYFDHNYANEIEICETGSINNKDMMVRPSEKQEIQTATAPNAETSSLKSILQPNRRKKNNKVQPLRREALNYLDERHKRELNIKVQELDLQQRKVAIEEKKIRLEEAKLQMEEKKNENRFGGEKTKDGTGKTKNADGIDRKKLSYAVVTVTTKINRPSCKHTKQLDY